MCTSETRNDILCGICIILILLGLGLTLIILGETLDIIDSVILGSIFLVFGTFVSTCIILMIARPIYNRRKIGYSSSDLKSEGLLRQESAFSQHGGSVHIHDAYHGSSDRQTVSSVMLEIRPPTTDSQRSELFSAKSRSASAASSNASFVTAPERNRDSLISNSEQVKPIEDVVVEKRPFSGKPKNKVGFEIENSYVTKF